MEKKIKKTRSKLIAGDDIKLAAKVMVSDPCYEIPTWCQIPLRNVKPGIYKTFVLQTDEGDWGIRNARLFVIHKDHINDYLNWEVIPGNVGVDSGQAGIFSLTSYRNNSIADKMHYKPDGQWNKEFWAQFPNDKENGEIWYEKICGMTINNDEGFGTYANGVASRSGIGDGSYELFAHFISEGKKNKIAALCIDFGLTESRIKTDFTKK